MLRNRKKYLQKILTVAVGTALYTGVSFADFPVELELSTLDGNIGVIFNGVAAADHAGRWVSAAGDVNGDGFDDLIIGAPDADPNAPYSGATYVVFGKNGGFSSPLNLTTLDGDNGFVINGEAQFDGAGTSVSAAGDVNGDGIDDLVIGAPDASPVESFSGAIYVVFGTNLGFTSPLELSSLDGDNGFQINGVNEDDSAGTSVSGAGDVNGDDIDDIIIGAVYAAGGAGVSYVVFGSNGDWAPSFELSALDGDNGFALVGAQSGDSSGTSVSGAGDVNGDTIDDVIIGAPLAGPVGAYPGIGYVVFGSDQAWAASLNLSDLDGGNGFAINGVAADDRLGTAVSAAGDINNDGHDDLLLGAPQADPNGAASGASYVVFGKASGQPWSASLNLSALIGTNGFAINGVSAGDESGSSVGPAGQVNMDAFDDLIVGAPHADPHGGSSGESYVVFGKDSGQAWSSPLSLSDLDGDDGFTLNGASENERSGRSVNAAGDINGDGRPDFLVGAPGDPLGDSAGRGYLVFGDTGLVSDLIFANGFE